MASITHRCAGALPCKRKRGRGLSHTVGKQCRWEEAGELGLGLHYQVTLMVSHTHTCTLGNSRELKPSHASLNIHSHVKQHNLTLLTPVVPWALQDASYVTYRAVGGEKKAKLQFYVVCNQLCSPPSILQNIR